MNTKLIHLLKSLIVSTILFGVFAAVYVWDITKIQNKIAIASSYGELLKKQQNDLFYQQIMLEESISQFTESNQLLHEWKNKLIRSTQLTDLLKEISRTGKADHLQVADFNPAPAVYEKGYTMLPFQAEITGSYANLADFIEKIAMMPWLIAVGDFVLTPNANATWTAELTLNIYLAQ